MIKNEYFYDASTGAQINARLSYWKDARVRGYYVTFNGIEVSADDGFYSVTCRVFSDPFYACELVEPVKRASKAAQKRAEDAFSGVVGEYSLEKGLILIPSTLEELAKRTAENA